MRVEAGEVLPRRFEQAKATAARRGREAPRLRSLVPVLAEVDGPESNTAHPPPGRIAIQPVGDYR